MPYLSEKVAAGVAAAALIAVLLNPIQQEINPLSEEEEMSLSSAEEIVEAYKEVEEFRKNTYPTANGFEEEAYKLQTLRRGLIADYQYSDSLFSGGVTIDSNITTADLIKAEAVIAEYRGAIMLFRQNSGNWGGEATAFRISEDLVLTNAHNLAAESGKVPEGLRFTLTDINGEEHAATFLGSEFAADIALLRLDQPVSTLPYFDMDNWATRHEANAVVITIGNPARIGFWTATIGRSEEGIHDRSDLQGNKAAVAAQAKIGSTEGSSGGPVFNLEGRLIGILWGAQSGLSQKNSGQSLSSYFHVEGLTIYSLAYDFKRKVLAWTR